MNKGANNSMNIFVWVIGITTFCKMKYKKYYDANPLKTQEKLVFLGLSI